MTPGRRVDGDVKPGALRVGVLSDAIPGRNGVGTYYDDLVQHLRDHVARVELFCPPTGEPGRPDTDGSDGGLSVPMPGDPTQRLHLPAVPELWRELSELRPHVILVGTPGAYGLLGAMKARRLDVPFCFAHHTELSKLADLYWTGTFGRAGHRILVAWNGAFLRRARTVMVHNEELVDTVRRMGARNVELVGTPISKPFLDLPPRPLDPGLDRACFVGRLAPEKELGQIVAAAEVHADVGFRIVGDGPLREEMDARARALPNLEMVGWVERSRVRELLDETDLLLLPSRYETFGTVALEAMARGRLALVSSQCGIAQWPELARGLFRMAPGEDLAEALSRIRALSPAERQEVADRGRDAALSLNADTVRHIASILARAADTTRRAGESRSTPDREP